MAQVEHSDDPSHSSGTGLIPGLLYFEAILATADDALIGINREAKIELWSAGAERIFGYTPAEIVGQPIRRLIPPEHRNELERILDRLARGDRLKHYQTRRVRKDGEIIDVVANVSPLWDRDGTVLGAVIIARNIGDQITIETVQSQLDREHDALMAAQAAESKFRGLFESAPDAIVIVDDTGRIVLVNSQALAKFGYERDELLGQSIEILVPEAVRGVHRRHRARYTEQPRSRPMGIGLDLTGRRKDGSELPVEISLSPMRSDHDGLLIMSIIRDVTERKQAERELRKTASELARSNAELEQFAYVASHDLQEPLRMIASYTELLARRYKGKLDEDADEFINFAVDGASRMQELIQDLLTYSRVGTQGKEFEPTDCNTVVDQVVSNNLAAAIRQAGATVTHSALPTVRGDATQLGQLFQNLIGNAIKFRGQAPPKVHVAAERRNREWLFSIRDNGIGIDPQYAARIFVIFQRLHSKSEYPGTGIGLAICKKIVERHGGEIWVESPPEGGTIVWFTIPIQPGEKDA